MSSSAVDRLRVISLLEGISFLVLLTCSVLKRTNEWEVGVAVMGPVHGVLFLLYVLGTLDVRRRLQWSTERTVKVALGAIPPFVPFFIERWLRTQREPARVG